MTQLVLHTGAPMTCGATIRAQLVAWREPLEAAGVAMVSKDAAEAWDRAAQQLVRGGKPLALKRLVRAGAEQGSQTLLLSSESVELPLRRAGNVERVGAFCATNDLSCRVVLVVREQLDLLNALYCQQVMELATFDGFDSFVATSVEPGRFNYADDYRALLDSSRVELVAVPYGRLHDDIEARTVLLEAGLPREALTGLPVPMLDETVVREDEPPGPVLVTATRLLHKRLARLGGTQQWTRDALTDTVGQLRARSGEQAWDEQGFWGWSSESAARASESYRDGNAEFADRAWGTEWDAAPTERPLTRLDLAAERPALVSDVMTTIQRLVNELKSQLPPKPPASGSDPDSDAGEEDTGEPDAGEPKSADDS